jgi:hypothetical protein
MSDEFSNNFLREDLFPGNASAFADLKEYMGNGHVVGFTGAGVSVPLFPTWTDLLSTMLTDATQNGMISGAEINEYKKLIETDPLDVASALEDLISKKVFRARLAKSFGNPSGVSTECQQIISNLNLCGIVTLNYDNGHEVAYASKGRNPNVGRSQDDSTLTRWLQEEVFNDADPPIGLHPVRLTLA